MSKKNLVFIVGSLRQASFNRQLADAAAALLTDLAEVHFLDYSDLPFMNQDLESPIPASVARVRSEIQAADGVWIFTPEYNHQIPGPLKNLLDWLSRPVEPGNMASGTAVAGKAVTLSGVGGRRATADVRAHLGELLSFMQMKLVAENETGVALPPEVFGGAPFEITDEIKAQLKTQADGFLKEI